MRNVKICFSFFVLSLICLTAYAQQVVNYTVTISGSALVCPGGGANNYWIVEPAPVGTWSLINGQIVSGGSNLRQMPNSDNQVWVSWAGTSGSISFHAEENVNCQTIYPPPYIGPGGCTFDEYGNQQCDWIYPDPYEVCDLHVYDGSLNISTLGTPSIIPSLMPPIIQGESVRLTTNQSGVTYQWKRDGLDIAGATGDSYSADQQGVYSVTTCGGTSIGVSLVVYPSLFITGSMGVGTTKIRDYKLSVNGKIRASGDIKVYPASEWSDFVFDPNYKLRSLDQVEEFIQDHGHLPEVPSAQEVKDQGIELGVMDAKLLQKIEELTLYIMQMDKETEQFKKDVSVLKSKLK